MRRRSKPHIFAENLAAHSERLQIELAVLPHGPERNALINKIAQIENAKELEEWVRSNVTEPLLARSTQSAEVGREVLIRSSAKRYYGGRGVVRGVSGRANNRYLIERMELNAKGAGLRSFWAARSEFEFIDDSPSDRGNATLAV